MIKSPSLEIIKTFSNDEFKRFREFLQSPYHNKNSNLVKIADYFKKVLPVDDNDKLTDEKIWHAVYGKKEFNYGIMKNLVYELKKVTEKFLAAEKMEKSNFYNDLFVVYELRDRTPGEIYEKKIVALKNRIESDKLNTSFLYNTYLLNAIDSAYKENHMRKESDKLSTDEEKTNSLLNFFFASLFYHNYNSLINSRFLNTKAELNLINIFTEIYEKMFIGKNLLSDLYYYSVKMTIDPDNEEYYDSLKESIYAYHEKLAYFPLKNFGAVMTGYCMLKKPGSKRNFVQEEFDVFCFFLEKGFYEPDSNLYFDSNLFSRLAELSLILNKPDWCREFINKYKNKLSPINRNIRTLIAEVYFENHMKNFENALELLSKAKPENNIEKLKIRSIELIIMFNLKDYERVYLLIKNFRSFLEYDIKVSPAILKTYIDFLNYTKILTDIMLNPNKASDFKTDLNELLNNLRKEKIANHAFLHSVINDLLASEQERSENQK